MTGPFDRLFGKSAFDLNHDGKISGAEWAFINDTFFEDANGISSGSINDEDDDLIDEIDIAGLDRDELSFLDGDERRDALEDAGLDPNDYDDFDFL